MERGLSDQARMVRSDPMFSSLFKYGAGPDKKQLMIAGGAIVALAAAAAIGYAVWKKKKDSEKSN